MTKLEAWKSWCETAGTESLASEFTLEKSSHGRAFSFAWGAAMEEAAKVCEDMGRGHGFAFAEFDCAAAIRARGQE